jgi:FkbM family methyltransferase
MGMGSFRKLGNRIQRPLWVRQLERSVEHGDAELTRIGSPECGWTVPASALKLGGTAVCVGAGEDISFDVELNKKGFNVFTVDPTPRAGEHVAKVIEHARGGTHSGINNSTANRYDLMGFDMSRFKFLDVGLWDEKSTKKFFAPKNKEHVSHSITNLQRTTDFFEAKCDTLKAVCEANKIERIDLLKMDVEGAEYTILRNIVAMGPLPKVLCVEFDEIRSPVDGKLMERIFAIIEMLTKAGYIFRHLETANALFVLKN